MSCCRRHAIKGPPSGTRNGYGYHEQFNSASLYGWRDGGDYGLIGSSRQSRSDTGTYVPVSEFILPEQPVSGDPLRAGGNVVQATSDDRNSWLFTRCKRANSDLELLVINKKALGPITGQFSLSDFQPAAQAQFWQYGEVQDTAQSESATGQSALANFTSTLPLSGSGFSYSFSPTYSMQRQSSP